MQTASHHSNDELSELFQRNLNLAGQHPATPDQQFMFTQPPTVQPQVYSSQHYTGTAYVRSNYVSDPVNSDLGWEYTLIQHDIDPASLLPSQVLLYQNANYEQRLRLLELWRISPPQHSDRSRAPASQTSLAQEEAQARAHYEQRIQQRNADRPRSSQPISEIEPYMASGYAIESQRVDTPHMDPVHAADTGLWQTFKTVQENRDKAWQEAREFERLQDLHRQVQAKRSADVYGMNDEEMVM